MDTERRRGEHGGRGYDGAMATAVTASCEEKRASEEEGGEVARVCQGRRGGVLIHPRDRGITDACSIADESEHVNDSEAGAGEEDDDRGGLGLQLCTDGPGEQVSPSIFPFVFCFNS